MLQGADEEVLENTVVIVPTEDVTIATDQYIAGKCIEFVDDGYGGRLLVINMEECAQYPEDVSD